MPIILLRMTSERHFFVALSFRGERREEGGGTNEKSGMLFYRESSLKEETDFLLSNILCFSATKSVLVKGGLPFVDL